MIETIDITPGPSELRAIFKRMGIGECPKCTDYGPHKEVEAGKHRNDEERRCRACRRVFYLDQIRYIAAPNEKARL